MTLSRENFVIVRPMMHDLSIFHWDKSKALMPRLNLTAGTYQFETCLRGLLITTQEPMANITKEGPTEVMKDAEAYSWLLEVLSGLHSPLLGETEVLGQFREQVIFPLGASVPSFLKGIVEDVKKIRHECLQNLGQKTYGSLARRMMAGELPLYFLGAGQMTREILPFMQKTNRSKVKVVARNLERARRKILIPCDYHGWNEKIEDPTYDLIVAAPISDQDLQTWVQWHGGLVNRCLDLRALPGNTPRRMVNTQKGAWSLEDFFQLQQGEADLAQQKVAKARAYIQAVTEKRWSQRWDRPFGWEDVCA